MRPSTRRRPSVGFTLTELLVTISVAGILVAIAVPTFTQMTANNRTRSAASSLHTALLKARSEALKRNCRITVQPKAGGWGEGWTIVARQADCNRTPTDEYAAGDLTLQDDAVRNVAVATNPAGLASVVYFPSGRMTGNPAFLMRAANNAGERRCVVVELGGMPRVAEGGAHALCPP